MASVGRGRWDRTLSRDERRRAERARIVDAVVRAKAAHGRALTLSHIALGAGVGRNTFYEHFIDVDAAIAAAEAQGVDAVSRVLAAAAVRAHTPIERLRSIARAWIAFAVEHPELTEVIGGDVTGGALGASGGTGLEARLRDVLGEARAAGAIGREPDPVRICCVVGAFEAAARFAAGNVPVSTDETAETLTDLTLRAFR